MSNYGHGISTDRKKTVMEQPVVGNLVQVVIGTAPINLLSNPSEAVNVPILLNDMEDVESKIGSCDEVEKYTIMQSVYASFRKHKVAPIVVINVLDPDNSNHVEAVAGVEKIAVKGMIVLAETGILPDKLVVSDSDTGTEYQPGDDYVASFDDNGYVVIAFTPDGALAGKEKVSVAYSKLNPDGVTAEDIIGGVSQDGRKSGISAVDDVFCETGIIPGVLVAPVFSKVPGVAVALDAKAKKVFSMFNSFAVVDMDTSPEGGRPVLEGGRAEGE